MSSNFRTPLCLAWNSPHKLICLDIFSPTVGAVLEVRATFQSWGRAGGCESLESGPWESSLCLLPAQMLCSWSVLWCESAPSSYSCRPACLSPVPSPPKTPSGDEGVFPSVAPGIYSVTVTRKITNTIYACATCFLHLALYFSRFRSAGSSPKWLYHVSVSQLVHWGWWILVLLIRFVVLLWTVLQWAFVIHKRELLVFIPWNKIPEL